jgi:hypothetical protein
VNGAQSTIRTCIVVTAARHVAAYTLIDRSFNHEKSPFADLAKKSICNFSLFY